MYLIRDFDESFLLRWAFILCVLLKKYKKRIKERKKKLKERKKEKKRPSFVQGFQDCDKLFVSMADLSITLMFELESNNLSAAIADIFGEAEVRVQAQKREASVMHRDRAWAELLSKGRQESHIPTLRGLCHTAFKSSTNFFPQKSKLTSL